MDGSMGLSLSSGLFVVLGVIFFVLAAISLSFRIGNINIALRWEFLGFTCWMLAVFGGVSA